MTKPSPQSKSPLAKSICSRAKDGSLEMKARWHFVVRGVLLGIGVIFGLILLVAVLSFIVFVIRETNLPLSTHLGTPGVGLFVMSLPWVLIAVSAVLLIIIEVLGRRFALSYRRPVLVSLSVLLLIAFVGGTILAKSKLHYALAERAQMRELPLAGPMYRFHHDKLRDRVFRGEIQELYDDGFSLQTQQEPETLTIVITKGTREHPKVEVFPKKRIIVIGNRSDDTVTADGLLPPRPKRMLIEPIPSNNLDTSANPIESPFDLDPAPELELTPSEAI